MIDNKERFEYIDSLRAIAALLVVWLHTSEIFVKIAQPSSQDGLYSVANFFDFGRIGVVIFFAISGFVIPSSLSGNRIEGARSFLIKRFFRMYPLYWLSIPFGLITSWYIWGKDISVVSILWNFTMVQEAAGHPSIQGLYWTLQTELVFYALCVALFLAGALRSVWVLGGLAFMFTVAHLGPPVLAVLGVYIPSIPSPTLVTMCLNLGVMFWGALFRSWIEQRSFPAMAKLALFGYVAAWCCLMLYAIKMFSVNDAYWKLCAPYAIGVLLFGALAIIKKVTSAWLVWLGTISYSIYLFHPVVMYTVSRMVQVSNMDWIKGWTTGSYMLLTVVLTILLSAITYRCIESPAIRLGSLLSKRTASKYRKKLQD
jgi:peptidoglycan/LPS O-acetylase OafA/YrhL